MSINSGSQNLSLLDGESMQLESMAITSAPLSQHLSTSNGESMQLESPVMYVNPGSQQMPLPSGHQVWFETAAMPFDSNLLHPPSMNGQSVRVDQPANSVGMASQHFPLTSTQFLSRDPSLKFQNAMRSSMVPLQSFSVQRQPTEMKFVPNTQSSNFLSMGAQHIPSKSKQMVNREPWPKVIGAMSVNTGAYPLVSTQKGIGQSEPLPRTQKVTSGNVGLQKLSSMNKRVPQPSFKANESIELVRSKMRESLVASLALGSEEMSKFESQGKDPPSLGTHIPETVETHVTPGDESSLRTNGSSCDTLDHPSKTSDVTEKHDELHNSFSVHFMNQHEKIQVGLQNSDSLECDEPRNSTYSVNDELLQGNGVCWKEDGKENQDSKISKLSHQKGLKNTASLITEKSQSLFANEDHSSLALKIEAELFSLFGGVNKKYKEKGRSLLFNLKDRNNPELIKQVLTGEIPPDRLCSMTAEELASKELSEWRIAKAEEFAQMVVLPDSDIDMRRLVKKTHKGEVQVEVERDDSAFVEFTHGETSLLQTSPNKHKSSANELLSQKNPNKRKAEMLSKPNGTDSFDGSTVSDKIHSAEQILSDDLTEFSNEKTDFMEDIIMEELIDEQLLEQVPSLDEFMKDLDSEPPFKNLTADIVQETSISGERTLQSSEPKLDAEPGTSEPKLNPVGDILIPQRDPDSESSKLKHDHSLTSSIEHSDAGSKDPLDIAMCKSTDVDATHKESESTLKRSPIHTTSESHGEICAHNADHVWEGTIQLNASSLVSVFGYFKSILLHKYNVKKELLLESGKQTSAKDWPILLEIKGRVRMEAFEKFLQELPSSRSRAIMILQFCWKEGSSESGRSTLSEMIESYVSDERVGYAEPAHGIEIYFCPLHAKTNEIFMKQLPKEHEGIFKSIGNGLIGIVVWRRHVTSKKSPRPSSSHLKHNSKKHSLSRKHQNSNANTVSKTNSLLGPAPMIKNRSVVEQVLDEDDAPPGFGPPGTRDEDDLPEFDFSQGGSSQISASKHNPLAHPADEKIRQLIHKYGNGQSRNNNPRIRGNTWKDNNDDDDDIPEWQPHQDVQQSHPAPPPPPPPPLLHDYHHGGYQQQQPILQQQPNTGSQHLIPMQQQAPMQHNPHQLLVPLAAPIPVQLQSLQTQMGVMQSVPGWQQQQQQQAAQWCPPPPRPLTDGQYAANGMMQQPYNSSYGGLPPPGTHTYNSYPPQDGVEWRRDVHRNG